MARTRQVLYRRLYIIRTAATDLISLRLESKQTSEEMIFPRRAAARIASKPFNLPNAVPTKPSAVERSVGQTA